MSGNLLVQTEITWISVDQELPPTNKKVLIACWMGDDYSTGHGMLLNETHTDPAFIKAGGRRWHTFGPSHNSVKFWAEDIPTTGLPRYDERGKNIL